MKNGENVLDKVGLDNALDKENTSVKFESLSYSIARKQDIDTDDNERDFATSSILPTNTKFVQDAVLDFDYNVLLLNKEVTLEDEDALNALKASYDEFDDDQKKQATQKTLLDSLLIEVAGIKNPSLAVVKKALLKVPAQIVTDFTMPTADGLTFEYKNAEDSSIFNLETGEYSEVIHEYKPVVLVAKCGDYSEEFTVNFGICHEGDHIIYTTGSKGTPKGPTSDGLGTYEQHLEAAGFGGIAVRCEGKVFFIGKNCYIELDDSKGTALTRAQLRPYGKEGANDINNTGFVNGVVKEYTGTGVLYHNDLTDTYGRANAGSYGYAKCFFALNENNEYAIRDIVQHTGENFSTDNYQVELAPGEYLWCPHIYETNVSYGTWFIFPGPSAAGGMLEEGVVVEFIAYKLPENKN